MKNRRDASRSLSMMKSGKSHIANTEIADDPYMLDDKAKTKVSDLSKFLSIKHPGRASLGVDQRGSTNTMKALERRNKLKLFKGRTVSVAQSIASETMSNFSFHPEINRSSMWKPKYEDHYDHQKMVTRMHEENKKIMAKKRLMSQEKQRSELEKCTFTPKLFTQKNQTQHRSIDPTELGNRMYDYAEKFKVNLTLTKKKLDQERGQMISFTPKIKKIKGDNKIVRNKNVYLNLYQDHEFRQEMIKQKRMEGRNGEKVKNSSGSFVQSLKLKGKIS